MADLTVSAAIDTFMGSADIAAIRTNIGLAAIGNAESLGWTDALLSRLAANSVGLGARLSITAPANSSALSSTGYSLTGSDATPMIDLAGTLNTTGSPAIIKVAMTNTASGATTKFLECLAGAGGTARVLGIGKDGTLDIYNAYTSDSVYERGFMRWVSNVLEIGTEHVGASPRDLVLKYNNVETARITNVQLSVTGSVTATSYVKGSYLRLGGSDHLHMYTAGDGVVTLYNTAETSFNRLQFGGTTLSFPSWKRSSTILQGRLADDSDFCPIQGKIQTHANAVAETPTATHTITMYDASGTAYRVLCLV